MCWSGKTNKQARIHNDLLKMPWGILCKLISGWQFMLPISSQNNEKETTAIKFNQWFLKSKMY